MHHCDRQESVCKPTCPCKSIDQGNRESCPQRSSMHLSMLLRQGLALMLKLGSWQDFHCKVPGPKDVHDVSRPVDSVTQAIFTPSIAAFTCQKLSQLLMHGFNLNKHAFVTLMSSPCPHVSPCVCCCHGATYMCCTITIINSHETGQISTQSQTTAGTSSVRASSCSGVRHTGLLKKSRPARQTKHLANRSLAGFVVL